MTLTVTKNQTATLGKRLLAILYDSLIAIFISFILTLIIQLTLIQMELVPLEHIQISADETVTTIPSGSIVNILLKSSWFVIPFLYFGYFWTKRGQTPGMRVWKIKAVTPDNTLMTWMQAAMRYIFALLGLGLLWMIVDKKHLALQDRLSKTILVRYT